METDKQREKRIYEENLKAMNVKTGTFSLKDIQLIMDQCNCIESKARKALKSTSGDLTKAIILITSNEI